tara:strand:- start:459 stop:761 length:303 start_codon:yes stop_codon:yes gene_type:complete
MAVIRITKDGESNEILATLAWAKSTYPNHTCEDVTNFPSEDDLLNQEKTQARRWRDNELERTDTMSLLPDHPKKTEIAAYRVKLRDWPSTSDFPNIPPEL